ncbi:tRNA (adenosine(37)-N6)-dimethylallyltransferase MiaA [Devosia sp.]|uniref:tRNA (adenosine(37)-N6)-dimethylallyltransferase MiaA n=1 Tax=Devosia sp. TaxID=1871048 RepID=UPI003A91EED6
MRAVLIAGPTASGKSALALSRARAEGGVIVNTDALQVYDGLHLITARPSAAEMAEVPHRLYGTVPPETRFSTGEWARAAGELIASEDRPLFFVGGTGLYFEALTKGFADVPEVPTAHVAAAEAELAGLDGEARARLIAARDPEMAARLKAPDPQRVARALAVKAATGKSLAWFQDRTHSPLLENFEIERIVLNPDRAVLRQRIADRFHTMFAEGAVPEVEALLSRQLNPALPVMKAIGVPEITAMLAGDIAPAVAVDRAIIATRQYAKRQRTWFRGRMADWSWIET